MLEYLPGDTLIHRLDVRTKMLGFLGLMIISFLFQSPMFQLGIVLLTGLLAAWIKIPLKKIWGMLFPLIPIIISIILITGFTFAPERFDRAASQTILFYALPGNHLGATVGGFLMGTTFILRLINMMIASSVLTLTTSMEEFTQFFQKMKVPAEVSMMLTMAIRFIPTLDKKRRQIIEAQKARGTRFNEKGIIGAIRSYLPIMIPMFINSIMMANSLSMAMLNRGYGLTRTWTTMKDLTFTSRDYWAIALILLTLGAAFYLRFGFKLGVL
ncbi:ABC-type cobalt transport system, permease component CbiQ [Desulfosporosinus orientis DSM 765]|uniref:ABC-type cobalt transport system, permease component CbiQ n=1 Tax=Desulfosporosinus orientis (strain ATCC 19365 / DSM 765 / NCIMB 8382 / VKM B-1628 / Singapore I) TaxID=768706 RepID=G7WBI6_DESOD|nr:energy-coupling factor transporter transmembrane component T [Desulfosporosinus orientis]AET68315.1 ABC-type cobalt transport system, permease component CbiQ [Desulfosporosinus orientis DSM 765]